MYVEVGHVVADVILSAQVPVRSHEAPQIPELHVAEPPVTAGHAFPHMPQFVVVFSAVSQPFGRLASQSPQPVLQLGMHDDEAHVVVPCAFVQAAPHPPQLLASVRRLISQPLAADPSQFA
jgi:hypothetical protein